MHKLTGSCCLEIQSVSKHLPLRWSIPPIESTAVAKTASAIEDNIFCDGEIYFAGEGTEEPSLGENALSISETLSQSVLRNDPVLGVISKQESPFRAMGSPPTCSMGRT